MSRMRTFAVFTVLVALMCLGIGTASADGNAAGAGQQSNAGIVSNQNSGGRGGAVHGNAVTMQQTGTGGGASNADNAAGIVGDSGTLGSAQRNSDRTAMDLYY
ncbi:hypothetical protein [Streptacidiphilus sp. EB129]|uniref:hypothetical protein n=1 Tax=Streptacidiphilus sp. EB129 TaxID=3156262 RepID=UPI0035160FC2